MVFLGCKGRPIGFSVVVWCDQLRYVNVRSNNYICKCKVRIITYVNHRSSNYIKGNISNVYAGLSSDRRLIIFKKMYRCRNLRAYTKNSHRNSIFDAFIAVMRDMNESFLRLSFLNALFCQTFLLQYTRVMSQLIHLMLMQYYIFIFSLVFIV